MAVGAKASQQERQLTRAACLCCLWSRRLQQSVRQRTHLCKLQLAALAQGIPMVLQLEYCLVPRKSTVLPLLLQLLLLMCLLRPPAPQHAA